jgi:lipopolysaccharide export LptBFGC system permease protein LptF
MKRTYICFGISFVLIFGLLLVNLTQLSLPLALSTALAAAIPSCVITLIYVILTKLLRMLRKGAE